MRNGWKIAAFLLFLGSGFSHAGECVWFDSPREIINTFSNADPDELPLEAQYLLGCLDRAVDKLYWRCWQYPPSWRLLRNTRRDYRDLGRNEEVVAALERINTSTDWRIRYNASIALAVYGKDGYCDTLISFLENCPACKGKVARVLVFAGDPRGVGMAIEAWQTTSSERWKTPLLDALYYQSTPEAVAFIEIVAEKDENEDLKERARWMLDNPMPVADSWKL